MSGCKVIRTMLITHSTLSLGSGEAGPVLKQEWVTQPCSVPLFSKTEIALATCRACARGWNHPNNYRADGPRPDKVIDP